MNSIADIDELMEIKNKVSWNRENENIMVEWCDVAHCYKWMHARAHQKFSIYNMMFTIPTITLSTISGTASFATGSLKGIEGYYAPMVIGAVNIFVGILSTIQQYLKIAEINEAHRVSAISWDKFSRNIKIEISKPPYERTDAGIFFKNSRNEYDRLMETCPTIPDYVIREFLKEVGGKPGTEQRKLFDELNKPDICNTIVSCRNQLYQEEDKIPPSMLVNPDSPLYPPKSIKKRLSDILKTGKFEKIEEFVKKFKEEHGREPFHDEIEHYLHTSSMLRIIPEYFKFKNELKSRRNSVVDIENGINTNDKKSSVSGVSGSSVNGGGSGSSVNGGGSGASGSSNNGSDSGNDSDTRLTSTVSFKISKNHDKHESSP